MTWHYPDGSDWSENKSSRNVSCFLRLHYTLYTSPPLEPQELQLFLHTSVEIVILAVFVLITSSSYITQVISWKNLIEMNKLMLLQREFLGGLERWLCKRFWVRCHLLWISLITQRNWRQLGWEDCKGVYCNMGVRVIASRNSDWLVSRQSRFPNWF